MLRAAPATSGESHLGRLPAQGLFVVGAISQYLGSAFAVLLFASVPAAGVVALADVHLAGSPDGFALAAGAGVFWALYIVLGHRLARDESIRPQDGLALGMAIGALALAPALVSSSVPALVSPPLLAACVLVGVSSSVVPYALEQVAMRRLPRARFALLLALLPATAAVIGAIVLGQVPGLVEAAGLALVVVAASLRSHADDAATSPPPSASTGS